MADYYNIAIIGSGNLAWHLGPELENSGHKITEVFSPNSKNAKALQRRLYNAELNESLDFSDSMAEIFFISVADDALEDVAQEVVLPDRVILVHTSGSQPISRLGYAAADNLGVFYPLQTFTKNKSISFDDIPILIEAENNKTSKTLQNLGKSISKKVLQVTSKERLAIHLAAVFACNFTNQLFVIAENILKNQGLNLELLRPLIAETINKGLDIGPSNAQTGPAARGDLETLDKHMEYLKRSEYKEIYKLITEKILNR